MVGRRGPHRARFGHLPRERRPPRSHLRPSSRPAASAALHQDAGLHKRTAWAAAPHRTSPARARTRPRPHTACAHGVHGRCAHRFSGRARAPRAHAMSTPVFMQQAYTYLVHLPCAHQPSHGTHTRRAHTNIEAPHTVHILKALCTEYSFSQDVHTSSQRVNKAHTTCTQVLTEHAHVLTHSAHPSSQVSHTFTHIHTQRRSSGNSSWLGPQTGAPCAHASGGRYGKPQQAQLGSSS